ncbi:hypothetical protein HWQ46_07720 [Shewanella sp. D64]|uniref:FimV/HubP family polar landmark protein n=1 Tax=unclassified Shewanella TaxID=196818 RepID=UPI0022BA5504|nr:MULTISPECIES: FimV/HubP family polar landmark protein [unclassified Shewanella]MEC4725432.1 hypothetical protein [Shewanella sp. D64]MEC4738751.1 hypothetical protein [Shewanella sp. E94]WBJ95042.1 hypothetical protein HWQ47_24985 [Shewanella sp. MTB7]
MAITVKIAVMFMLVLGSYTLVSRDAYAQITHVSINQQLFTLGEYPKFRMNIVADSDNYNKTQFIVRQGDNEEKLMVKPINKFLLLLSGVEDVNDPSAILVIQEYRVNKWREVKRFSLFSGDVSSVIAKAKPVVLKSEVKMVEKGLVLRQTSTPDEILADHNCLLDSLPGQTLWRIALQYSKEWEMTTQGSVVAIYEANPKAFNSKNISSLKEGAQLLCPSKLVKDKYRDSQVAQRKYQALLD